MNAEVRTLDDGQTRQFDVEYISEDLFRRVRLQLETYLGSQQTFHLMDIGGGNGLFSDRVLNTFPQARVTLLEPDAYLLGRNRPQERKYLLQGTFQDATIEAASLDAIELNWVLHHFVGDSYAETVRLQKSALQKAYHALRPGGILLIFENYYDGVAGSDLPGRLIYELTAARSLKVLTERLGANTAGVGVGFHSHRTWVNWVREAGFDIVADQHCYPFGNLGALKRSMLGLKEQRVGFLAARKLS